MDQLQSSSDEAAGASDRSESMQSLADANMQKLTEEALKNMSATVEELRKKFEPKMGRATSSHNFPRATNSHNVPKATNSHNFPRPTKSHNVPKATNSHNFPRATNSHNFPRGPNTHNFPRGPNTHNFPRGPNTHNFPRGPNSHNFQIGPNTHNFPIGPNTHNFPRGPNLHNFPRGPNSHNFSRPPNSHSFTRATNSQNFERATNFHNFERPQNSQHFERSGNSHNFPRAANSHNFPKNVNSHNFLIPPNSHSFPKVEKAEVELVCSDFFPSDPEDTAQTEVYLDKALASCEEIFRSDFFIKATQRRGSNTRIEVICSSQSQAQKVVHEINRKTGVHKIRAQLNQSLQVWKGRNESPPTPVWHNSSINKPELPKVQETNMVEKGSPGRRSKPTKIAPEMAPEMASQKAPNVAPKMVSPGATSANVYGNKQKFTKNRPAKKSKVKKTAIELVCSNYPQDETGDIAKAKTYLKTALGACKGISLANIDIESVLKVETRTSIKVLCVSRAQARKVIHGINDKTSVHKIRARMAQRQQSMSESTEQRNTAPKKRTVREPVRERSCTSAVTENKATESYSSEPTGPPLQRMKTEFLRKIVNISSAALKGHCDKIRQKEEIIRNLDMLDGTGLEHYDEMVTAKMVHEQKLEELQNQRLEYENHCKYLTSQLDDIGLSESFSEHLDSLVDLCRLEAKKLKGALPIYACKSGIISSVVENDFLVLLGETGSGKSTQTPQYLSESDLSKEGMIACIQPRQVAAISLACQVAKEMGTHVGGIVGYKAGYNTKVGPSTKLVYTTNHAMLKEIIKDPLLKEYSCVLVDEAHERSIYCDLLLGMIKEAKRHRPDLKVVVMSATIDPKLFVDYFNGCPIVKVSGRTFPVEVVYKNYDDAGYDDKYLREAVDKAKHVHRNEPPGDILVFLTSPAEIEKAVQELEQERGVLSLPLHGRLQPDQQKAVFNQTPAGMRKIVFATNAAETSITITGIKYVIDTGKAKEMSFDSTRGISSLEVQWISRSSADQRKGRAGRIESGKCFRLYTEETYNTMAVGSVPEILKSSTEMAFLTLMTLGIDDPTKFDFVEAPSRQVMDHAMNELRCLGAVLPGGGLTELGKKLAVLNLEPKYGKLLLQTIEQGFGFDGMVVTALLTVGSSIFFRMGSPSEKQMADKKKTRFCSPKGDIYTMYEVFKEWYGIGKSKRSTWCVENSINGKSMRMCLDFVNDLNTTLKKELSITVDLAFSDTAAVSAKLDRLIVECYRKNLACFTGHSKTGYYIPQLDFTIVLHPSSAVQMLKQEPKWIVFASVLETGKLYLLNSTGIDNELVEEVIGIDMIDCVRVWMQSLHMDLAKVYSASAGQSVLSKFIGAKGQNVRRIEDEIHEKYLEDIPSALDISVSSRQVNFFCSPEGSKPAVDFIESELLSLKTELVLETLEEMVIPNTDVYYVMEEGAMLKTVLMAEDYRTIVIRQKTSGITESKILELFSKYGKIQRHFVFKPPRGGQNTRNPGWGKIMYEDETVAKHVMHRYRQKTEAELHHFVLEPEERKMSASLSTSLSFSWLRRLCTGLGFLTFSDDLAATDAYLSLSSTGHFIVQISRKNACDLALKNVSPLMTENDLRKIVDPAIPHVDYQVKLVRQRLLPATDELVEATKEELVKKIREETLETNFHLELKKPQEKNFDWYGYIKTPNAEIAQKIHDICSKSIFMGSACVQFELKLSGRITLNQRLFNKLQRQYEDLVATASDMYRPAQLHLEQGNNRLQYLRIQAPDATAFTKITKMCNNLVFGLLIPIPSEIEVDILGSHNGRKFMVSVERQFHCVLEVDRRNRGVRVYVNEGRLGQVTEMIERFLENNQGRISRQLELTGEGKPPGVLKYLLKTYGVTLKQFIDKTKVDCAEILLREHILAMTGTNEAIADAIEEVEKASKDLLENPPNEGPAFTDDCPICLCPITEKIYYMERCGHAYCHACVKAMFTTAGRNKELPITCAKEDCGEKIVVKDIKNLFHPKDDGYKSLFDAALEKYVLLNSQRVKYCLTADCKMVYKVSGKNKTFECPSCFVKMCRCCHSPSHEGLPCDTYKIINSDEDRGVADWLKEKKRDRCLCPKCNALIEKSGGCNHMTCRMCNSHFCWICKKSFSTSGETYGHLSSTHGNFV